MSTLGTRVPSTGYHVLSKVVVPTTCGPKSTASTSFTSGSQGRSTGPASGSSITVANPHQLAAKPSLHPAKLPGTPLGPVNPAWKSLPPRPTLSISRVANGMSFYIMYFTWRPMEILFCRYALFRDSAIMDNASGCYASC